MVADVNSGKAKEIWQCPNETGGFSQYYPSKTLRWAAEDAREEVGGLAERI